ncbi:MAG: hydantoinase/oxoprolinase family protein [Pseudomonadota bacterium]
MSRFKIAIDIGGTFTDGVLYDTGSGRIWLEKALTTPADPGEAVTTVAGALLAKHVGKISPEASAIEDVVHATTLVTNAIIQRKGARVALIVTQGFADTLRLRREDRYDLYDLDITFPDPLVADSDILELGARLGFDGLEITPVDTTSAEAIASEVAKLGADATAICFLHSYVNDQHERAMANAVEAALPGRPISISSDIACEIREYERMSTTVANAYVQPLTSEYLRSLQSRLTSLGAEAPLRIMVSSGGFTTADIAASTPVRLLESGPAAGVLSAINTAKAAGVDRVLAFDMGGTTAKLCVAVDAKPEISNQFEAGRVRRFKKGSGLPIMVPSIDMIEIGAGGGSIAHVADLGLLNVGPQSSGAVPGPACYARGGDQPTVTDADLILGYLSADNFLGGQMKLSETAAAGAIGRLADELSMAANDVAYGIHDLVNENMASAARVHIAEKGMDPRGFSMVATGGAGPVHVVEVAHKLGINRVLCPVAAGNGSCLGLLVAPPRVDRSWSKPELIETCDWQDAKQRLEKAYAECTVELEATGTSTQALEWSINIEMRYEGQGDTITVTFPYGDVESVIRTTATTTFSETYRQLYGRTLPDTAVEMVTWRLIATSPIPATSFEIAHGDRGHVDEAQSERAIFLPEQRALQVVPVFDRYSLGSGTSLAGPLILQEPESTIVVARPAQVSVLDDQTISIELS